MPAIGNFQYWLTLQLWEVCFFTVKGLLFPRLPGCFVVPCLTLKKIPNTLWTQSAYFSIPTVRCGSEPRDPQTHHLLYIKTDRYIFLPSLHPASAASLMSLLLQAVAEHKPFTCPSHNLFQLGQFVLNLQWPERIYLEYHWHIKITCWRFPSSIPQGRSACKEEIPYFNTFPWIMKSLRLERTSKMILCST